MEEASSSSYTPAEMSFKELITRQHANLMSLPEELCPPSRPSSPISEERVSAMRDHILRLVNFAGGDTTNPKWGYVSRYAHLRCTSRGYMNIKDGVRVGDGKKVKVGKDFKWELPQTEEGWTAYQKKWEKAVDAEEERRRNRNEEKATKTSKYFDKAVEKSAPLSHQSKAEVVREKVARWQAKVITVAAVHEVPVSQEMVTSSQPVAGENGKTTEKGGKVQVSLGFPVVKRSSATSGKGSAASRPQVSSAARVPAPSSDGPSPSKTQGVPSKDAQGCAIGASQQPSVPKITELPELSFLPPSFPSQLQTSTPPLKDKRHKPQPIAPCSPPISPFSVKSFNSAGPERLDAQQASSSQPLVSPISKPAKRGRVPTASPEDVRMNTSPPQVATRSPLAKRARTDAEKQGPVSSGSVPVPPSTPPISSLSLPTAPATPVTPIKGLGNAKGLPVPTTPNAQLLPTLSELLASSRRSRPRPRPPSRKHASHSTTAVRDFDEELPVPKAELTAADSESEASPTKTYFSSPASGSSGSPGSVSHRPRSPISPLGFTQHPSGFAPRFISSQRPQPVVDGVDDPFLSAPAHAGTGLMRGSSGFVGMGYSSQFDVEGHVEQVSELLERDVDFDGWLRDLDTEEEVHDHAVSTSSLGESMNVTDG